MMIACCRAFGLPARSVSGYLCSDTAAGSASHAWMDICLGEANAWLSLDVTHLAAPGSGHCRLALGRGYWDAAPVRRGSGEESMQVQVNPHVIDTR